MDKRLTRRAILNTGAAALGGSILSVATLASTSKQPAVPWPWKELKPADVQERAYQSAWAKVACMYGTFEAIIGTPSEKYGAPYSTFPIEATLYGSGGFGGLGSICGTINACGLLFGLFAKKQEDLFALCQEISLWYENAQLPAYKPRKPRLDIPMTTSVSRSHLCHVSATTWANASGHQLHTQPWLRPVWKTDALKKLWPAVRLLFQRTTAESDLHLVPSHDCLAREKLMHGCDEAGLDRLGSYCRTIT